MGTHRRKGSRRAHQSARSGTAGGPAAQATKTAAALGAGAYAALLAIVVLTVLVYAPVVHHQFLSWDDPQYVTDNPHVRGGLTWANVQWAFTTSYASNWHPLTWLSHMADVDWYGVTPGPAHVTNLALHVATTAVLFAALCQMTGAWAPSSVVAALFAVHPLHVESVAWIAERKDVLSTFFWALTLWAYLAYVRRPGLARSLAVAGLFLLGLLAKPMILTLPFVLLLLDVWPLGRISLAPGSGSPGEHARLAVRLVREKLLLFALAAASAVATFVAQRRGGAVAELEVLPLGERLANAVVSYVAYLRQTVWPTGLAAFYPYPRPLSPGLVAASALTLVAISVLAVRSAQRRPYLLVGWLWYVGTLVPVIGLVHVGSQARADRYTYVPLIGIFMAVVWLARDLAAQCPRWRPWFVAAAVLAIGACAMTARVQAMYWKDSLALWQHSADVTAVNEVAETGLGRALADQGRTDEAVAHYRAALGANPDYPFAHNDLGVELRRRHLTDEAILHLSAALRLRPNFPEAANNLGNALADAGRTSEAIARYGDALGLEPDYAEAHNNLGVALAKIEKWDDAVAQFAEVVRLRPNAADALTNLAMALASAGHFDAARQQASAALRINPQDAVARRLLSDLARLRGAPPASP